MSFDKETRNALARMVGACRRLLTEDITDQLRGTFGLYPDGTTLSLDQLSHLSMDQSAAGQSLRELLDHFATRSPEKSEERRRSAYDRLVLEISFTVLNRLAALRLCEERGLIVECVRKGMASDGFRLFESVSGGVLGTRYDAYRVFLECLFDELALDLGVLFDRTTAQSAVFPTERCLEEVFDLLNDPGFAPIWQEDETIGWIYQYFNPPEERRAMRDASQAPRNSRELAVRNQFFTPRYVVEFLTDNTLGRIWYEMRKGDTRLKEECRYLVRRPNEIFLAPGEQPPASAAGDAGDTGEPGETGDEDLSQEELLKKPVYIVHRPKKDPRDIKILDPACGSGHFLLYAFDLLEAIYMEAWEDSESPAHEESGRRLAEEFGSGDDLRKAIPGFILRYNLHGIDIDHRAVQIAALALWLRAQRTYQMLGLKAAARPQITKSNIVCAEPMPGEVDMLREFTATLQPKVLGQLVEEVFKRMGLAGEAGSLLKIEEEIRDAVAGAKKQWVDRPRTEQQVLFPELVKPKPKQLGLFDVRGITDKEFWDQAEELILTELRRYAERAENGRAIRRRLFVEDAAQGFAFVDVCRKRFDVVLMNPPFGEASSDAVSFLVRLYQDWNANLLCAFISYAAHILIEGGLCGVIYDRTANIKNTYEKFRQKHFLGKDSKINLIVDLGWNVLDANVEVSASIIHRASHRPVFQDYIWGCNLTQFDSNQKPDGLYHAIHDQKGPLPRLVSIQVLQRLPNQVIGYYFPEFLIRMFERLRSFEEAGIKVFQGHTIKSDNFFRYWWEIPYGFSSGLSGQWTRLYNGSAYSRYFYPQIDVVFYGNQGSGIVGHKSTIFRNMEWV